MSDQNKEGVGRLIEKCVEGGLLQMLTGPAGKAISRLVAGVVDYPAAWLERVAVSVRDETKGRTRIRGAVAKAAAQRASQDAAVLDRAIFRALGEEQRKQENREAIAQKAIEYMEENTSDTASEGPSDDWMNIFVSMAEKASSENLRDLFARALAGEVRNPGGISFATLHFFSIMDSSISKDIHELLPWILDGDAILRSTSFSGGHFYMLLTRLKSLGIVSTEHTKIYKDLDDGAVNGFVRAVLTTGTGEAFFVRLNDAKELKLSCAMLTMVGKQVVSIIHPQYNQKSIDEILIFLQKVSTSVQFLRPGEKGFI